MFFNTETGVELKNEKQKIIRKIYQLSREKRSWDLDNDITDKDLWSLEVKELKKLYKHYQNNFETYAYWS
tara:strand:+ start:930 stop:1139 length:210 start_codon:yes stop_codon:yes gene_type:complete